MKYLVCRFDGKNMLPLELKDSVHDCVVYIRSVVKAPYFFTDFRICEIQQVFKAVYVDNKILID